MMNQRFEWAEYKARQAKGNATDPTLYALAEALESLAQGLNEDSRHQDRVNQALLRELR